MSKGRGGGKERGTEAGQGVVKGSHVRMFNVVLQTVQVLVTFAAVANGALIRLGSNVLAFIRDKVTVTMLVVVL